jgi:predicted HNH restriction endonuclease
LHKRIELAMQVRARRRIQPESAKLLAEVLERNTRKIAKRASAIDKEIRYCEGQRKATNVLSPIRNRKLRADALARRGFICEVCKFDFEAVYGDFARLCVEVHHIVPIHLARQRGVKTSWKDVIVICPNCHGALHRFHQPTNLKAFMKAVKAKSGA